MEGSYSFQDCMLNATSSQLNDSDLFLDSLIVDGSIDNNNSISQTNHAQHSFSQIPRDQNLLYSTSSSPGVMNLHDQQQHQQQQQHPLSSIYFIPTDHPIPEFLHQLTKMLSDNQNSQMISWIDKRIVVHDPPKLTLEVFHKYFRHSNYASFQRQLNYFGFRKVTGKKGKMHPCSYVHDLVTHDLRSLLTIKRKNTKKGNPSGINNSTLTKTKTSGEESSLLMNKDSVGDDEEDVLPSKSDPVDIKRGENSSIQDLKAQAISKQSDEFFREMKKPKIENESSSSCNNSNKDQYLECMNPKTFTFTNSTATTEITTDENNALIASNKEGQIPQMDVIFQVGPVDLPSLTDLKRIDDNDYKMNRTTYPFASKQQANAEFLDLENGLSQLEQYFQYHRKSSLSSKYDDAVTDKDEVANGSNVSSSKQNSTEKTVASSEPSEPISNESSNYTSLEGSSMTTSSYEELDSNQDITQNEDDSISSTIGPPTI